MKSFKIQSIRSFTLALMVSAGLWASTDLSAQSGEILHNPAQLIVTEGETFEVTVEVHSGAQPISVADFHMEFDPEYLEVLQVSAIQGGLAANSILPVFNNVNGTISMGSFQVGSQAPSGFMEAMQITFMAVQVTPLTSVEHPVNVFPKSILAYAGEDHLGNVGPLDITILPGIVLSDGPELDADLLSLELWPNPTSEQATVTFQTSETGEISLELYDVAGKLVAEIYRGTAASGTLHRFDVNVQQLNNGLYLCSLMSNQGNIVKRLVVSK